MSLIRELNESLLKKVTEGKDPFETDSILDIPGVKDVMEMEGKCGGHENEEMSTTELSNDQINQLANWVHDTIEDEGRDPNAPEMIGDTALEALDNVAGFETADNKTIQAALDRIVAAYHKAHG